MTKATQVSSLTTSLSDGKESWKTGCMQCSKIPEKEFYAWHELGLDEQKAMELCKWKNADDHPNLGKKQGSRYGVTCSKDCDSKFLKKLEEVREANYQAFLKKIEA